MDDLDPLEAESLDILRDAFGRIRPLAMLWSPGKETSLLLWLARKAFRGRVPFPLLHLDTGLEFPEAYAFRDRYVREWGLELIDDPCPPVGAMDATLPPAARLAARKAQALRRALARHGFRGLLAGIPRENPVMRAREAVLSACGQDSVWTRRDPSPAFRDLPDRAVPADAPPRIHPLRHWREVDIWRYVAREGIPVCPLYFARQGERFPTLGEVGITFPIASQATDIPAIIAELRATRPLEGAGPARHHQLGQAFGQPDHGGRL